MTGETVEDGSRSEGGSEVTGQVEDRGPGPFITHRLYRLEGDLHRVANSRRHRKGLRPHHVLRAESADYPPPLHPSAFRRFWAPGRLAWWVAMLFVVGSGLFTLAGAASTWPASMPVALQHPTIVAWTFVVGAVFFTAAAWLQWTEALNGDVALALRDDPGRSWRWFGWRPRNLGYLASAIQLVGTLFFNLNTLEATVTGLDSRQEAIRVWTPDMLGCLCFLAASYLAYAEVSQGYASLAARSLSWWIAIFNLAGSVAFQISALYSFAFFEPISPNALFWANWYTTLGGLCFLIGSYLMIAEVFDEEEEAREKVDGRLVAQVLEGSG